MSHRNDAEQNHWSERGRATSVAIAGALGRPRRSALPFDMRVPNMAPRFEQELTETTQIKSGGSYSLLPPFPPVLFRVAEHVTESGSRWRGHVPFRHVEPGGRGEPRRALQFRSDR